MAKTRPTNETLIRLLAQHPDATWAEAIPIDSQTDFEKWGRTLLSSEYEVHYNVFLDQLINRVAVEWIKSATMTNLLAFLRNGEFNLGDAIDEIFVGLVQSHTFDAVGTPDQFEKFKPDVHQMFHLRTRKDYYPVTVQYEDMRAAFVRTYGLATVVERIIQSLYESNTRDSYVYQKEGFVQYRFLHPTGLPLQPTQFYYTDRPVDDTTGADFYRTLKTAVRAMRYPSNKYNAAGETLQNLESNFNLFMRADVAPSLEVDTLARTFNNGQLTSNITPNIVELDDFGAPLPSNPDWNNDDVLAVLMPTNAMGVLNNLFTLRTADNARGLYRNYFLHVWDLHYCSYFENVIYILDKAITPPPAP